MLKSKLHRVRVTGVNVDYEGSIALDPVLKEAADILPFEKVQVVDVNNGARFETYAIVGGPREVAVNGAAARLVARGDIVIVLAYTDLPEELARQHRPHLAYVDENNCLRHEDARCRA
jgi:aspartate 1-decarboxylase